MNGSSLLRLVLWLALLAGTAEAQTLAVRARSVLTGTGQEIKNGVILIEDGKIKSVGPETPVQTGVPVVDYLDATICPGFVDPHGELGAGDGVDEVASAFEPTARALDYYHPKHKDFAQALEGGVTSIGLAPGSADIVGGLAAIVKTGGERDTIVRDGAFLAMTLARSALSDSREPTSPVGMMHLVRRALDDARAAKADSPLKQLAGGKLRALLDVHSEDEIARALDLAAQYHLDAALLHAEEAGRLADDLKSANLPVIMGAFTAASPKRVLLAPAKLAKAGIVVAFTADAPYTAPGALRATAALAVRHGMAPDEALRAITSAPAQILGAADRIGSIAPGRDADLGVWSGDPLDLRSRLEAVYVKGVRVVRHPQPASSTSSNPPAQPE